MMSIFNRAKDRVNRNKERAEKGLLNCIPFGFPRFEQYLPGIMQKKYYLITSNSGVGKSQITDSLFLYNPYNHILNNSETDITVKIFYYSLELDKESKIIKGVSKRLYEKYGIIADVNLLQSYGKKYCSDELFEKFKECKDYFEKLEDICTFYDEPINPYGIFKEVNSYMLNNGTVIKKKITINDEEHDVFDYYKPNKENHYVILIVDHLSLLNNEKQMSQHETIKKFSANDCVYLRNRYGVIIVNVQQQMASQEEKQYTFSGKNIIEKLEPSLDGLADCKLTQRDANIVLGLFAPDRHGIKYYKGYDISRLGDNYRNWQILKNRDGISNVNVGLYFNGAVNYFKEMPPITDENRMKKVYELKEKQTKK